MKLIDSHIHFDRYTKAERNEILKQDNLEFLITVSMNLQSSIENLHISNGNQRLKTAFGYHPEQPIPSEKETKELLLWMESHLQSMIAVGEVGLPFYKRQEEPAINLKEYISLLEKFIKFAKQHNKPIILHAVYDDAPVVCELLEKYEVKKAHFHWFKGDEETIKRMIHNGYFISITPDVCYEEEIQALVEKYPLEQMMIETDGPWEFEGMFAGQMTNPRMMNETVKKIAQIKKLDIHKVYKILYMNTVGFYNL